MNKKVLASSLVALILCLCLMVGCTFALFTSESKNNVTVSGGRVKVISTIDQQITTYSREQITAENGVFANKGTASLDENGDLSLKNVTPGDKVELKVNILNQSNVAVKYRIKVAITGDLAQALVVTATYPNANSAVVLLANNKTEWEDIDTDQTLDVLLSVELPINADKDYMEKTADIAITVEAIQANGTDLIETEVTAAALEQIITTANDNGEINVDKNYALAAGETWTPIVLSATSLNSDKKFVINGNNYTISGLNAPLFAESLTTADEIIINDLIIDNANVVSENDTGSGVFFDYVDNVKALTLNNCHIINSNLSGSRTGGFIGWANGNESGGDRTVFSFVNCSIKNSVISGNGTVGGIVGHAGAHNNTLTTFTDCVVEDCVLTSYDDSYRVGAIIGTANIGEVTITTCTSNNNTLKQDNKGVEILRPEGQTDLYGRFVPGTSGKLTVDGQSK